jgi:hypothetical protein
MRGETRMAGTFTADGLVPGQMLRIRYRPPSGRGRDFEIVARFLGTSTEGQYVDLDQRPKAGTVSVRRESVVEAYATDATEVQTPRRTSRDSEVRLY